MPQIIKTVDEVMDQRKQDSYFINFDEFLFRSDEAFMNRARDAHFAWFERHGLATEAAAPRGWLSGHPGCYAVYFDGCDDPRIVEYTSRFESHSGESLDPDSYQMVQYSYAAWLGGGGPALLVDGDEDL